MPVRTRAEMSRVPRGGLSAIVLCCVAAATACGGGGGGGTGVVTPATPAPSSAPTYPPTSSATLAAGAQPASAGLAAAGNGISASVAVPAASGNATLNAVLSTAAPGGVPALQSMRRRPATIGAGPLVAQAYVTLTASSTVSFATAPAFTFMTPPAVAFRAVEYVAVYDPAQAANGWTTLEGPAVLGAGLNGSTATFTALSQQTTFVAGQTYVFVLFNATQTLPTPTPTPVPNGNVRFSVTVPAGTSALHRRPAYVSNATQSVRLALEPNGPSATAPCASTCTVSLQAPPGNVTVSVVLYDDANAAGNVLSRGSTTVAVASNATTDVALTLGGVPHDVAVSLPDSIPGGTAAIVPIGVVTHDAQHRTIVGSDPYVDANGNAVTIALSSADTTAHGSGKTTIQNGSLHTPADAPKLAYDGNAMTSTTVTATAPQLAAATATMRVVPGIAKTIAVGRYLDKLTFGGDGYLWYTGQWAPVIGRVSTGTGTYTEFTLPSFSDMVQGSNLMPLDIVTARDGSVWFNFEGNGSTQNQNDSGIGTITTAGTPALYRDPFGSSVFPIGLTAGSDGNLWFAQANGFRISRITTAGVITSFPVSTGGGWNAPSAVTTGPDGNVWAAAYYYLDRIAPDGTATLFPTPYAHDANAYLPDSLAPGSDGNVWFTESTQSGGTQQSKVAKITPSGAITEYAIPAPHTAQFIVAGPDGNAWFVDGRGLGSITPAGTVTFYDLSATVSYFSGLTVSPDGNFWLTGSTNGSAKGSVIEVVY